MKTYSNSYNPYLVFPMLLFWLWKCVRSNWNSKRGHKVRKLDVNAVKSEVNLLSKTARGYKRLTPIMGLLKLGLVSTHSLLFILFPCALILPSSSFWVSSFLVPGVIFDLVNFQIVSGFFLPSLIYRNQVTNRSELVSFNIQKLLFTIVFLG